LSTNSMLVKWVIIDRDQKVITPLSFELELD